MWMEITETEDGFESDSEREESSEEDEDTEKLRQHQQRTAKAISRHSTRRSSQQQQQANEDKGSHCILKYSLWLCIYIFFFPPNLVLYVRCVHSGALKF